MGERHHVFSAVTKSAYAENVPQKWPAIRLTVHKRASGRLRAWRSAAPFFSQEDFLPASPAVRLTHDFRFASVTGEISGTWIVYLPYPYFMLRPSVFLTSIFLSITVTLAVSQQVESGNSDGLI